jgi:hypothetical protein
VIEITSLRWYGTIGFVLVTDVDEDGAYFKVYVGNGSGWNTQADARYIATAGMPVLDEVLARHLAGEFAGDREYRY